MTMICKMRSERRGEHVHTTVFMGYEGKTLANVGTLCQHFGEWQLFGAALLLGAKQTKGHLKVINEGDEQVVALPEEEA